MNCRGTLVLWLLFIPVIFCGISCSSKTALNPAQGKVTLKGQPLEGAKVILHPSEEGVVEWPTGVTAADGTFTLKTGDHDGAAAGSYKVSIVCMQSAAAATPKPKAAITMAMPEDVDRLKGAYSNPATSKLTAEIKDGSNQLEPFDLK